jgi:hypothetical protein
MAVCFVADGKFRARNRAASFYPAHLHYTSDTQTLYMANRLKAKVMLHAWLAKKLKH